MTLPNCGSSSGHTTRPFRSFTHRGPLHQKCTTWFTTLTGLIGTYVYKWYTLLQFWHYYVFINLRCGPITHLWCMRFEAKHQWFKKLAHNLGNFVNVAKTLAWRHQRLSCYDLMGPVLKRTTQIKKGATHTHTHTCTRTHTPQGTGCRLPWSASEQEGPKCGLPPDHLCSQHIVWLSQSWDGVGVQQSIVYMHSAHAHLHACTPPYTLTVLHACI